MRDTIRTVGFLGVAILVPSPFQGKSDPAEVVRTKKLEIINKKGEAMITLQLAEERPRILVQNQVGKPAFVIAVKPDGDGTLGVGNGDGKIVLQAGCQDGHGVFAVKDENGTSRFAAGIGKTGRVNLVLRNEAGKSVFGALEREGGSGGFIVHDSSGEGLILAGELRNGSGGQISIRGVDHKGLTQVVANGIGIFGDDGETLVARLNRTALSFLSLENKSGAGFGIGENGGLLNIRNKTGEYVVLARCEDDGSGRVSVYDREGNGHKLTPPK